MKMMSWNEEMTIAYQAGLNDGKRGFPDKGENYVFVACYEQGYRHGIKINQEVA
jgi:hypothetical protein